jgi:hypothetical protein
MQVKVLGIISVDFDVTDVRMITYRAYLKYFRKKNGAAHYRLYRLKKPYASVRR